MSSDPSADVDVGSLITRLGELLQKTGSNLLENDDFRAPALEISRQLNSASQKPEDASIHIMNGPAFAMAARLAIDMRVFEILAGSSEPQSAADLAKAACAEELLIIRLLRVLCAIGLVHEAGVRLYAANPVTHAFTKPGYVAAHKHFFDQGVPALARMPEYFASPASNYRCPTDPRSGPFQFAKGTDLQTFDFWTQRCPPAVMENFNVFMSGMGNLSSWLRWFPVRERLLDGFQAGSTSAEYPDQGVLLVDVGGNVGHDLKGFAQHVGTEFKCRLVLQDLPGVVAKASELDARIEPLGYNFFSPQPIRGARVYFLHKIMHDWPNVSCLSILRNLRPALLPGYSRLLVHEYVLPDKGASVRAAALDLAMMTMHVGMERTRDQWLELLEEAGLRVIKIWERDGEHGIIEAERAEV